MLALNNQFLNLEDEFFDGVPILINFINSTPEKELEKLNKGALHIRQIDELSEGTESERGASVIDSDIMSLTNNESSDNEEDDDDFYPAERKVSTITFIFDKIKESLSGKNQVSDAKDDLSRRLSIVSDAEDEGSKSTLRKSSVILVAEQDDEDETTSTPEGSMVALDRRQNSPQKVYLEPKDPEEPNVPSIMLEGDQRRFFLDELERSGAESAAASSDESSVRRYFVQDYDGDSSLREYQPSITPEPCLDRQSKPEPVNVQQDDQEVNQEDGDQESGTRRKSIIGLFTRERRTLSDVSQPNIEKPKTRRISTSALDGQDTTKIPQRKSSILNMWGKSKVMPSGNKETRIAFKDPIEFNPRSSTGELNDIENQSPTDSDPPLTLEDLYSNDDDDDDAFDDKYL